MMLRIFRLTVVLVSTGMGACHHDRRGVLADATGGDPARGAALIRETGCGSCHTIPGIRSANGRVGPPLTSFAERTYIAGRLPNTPRNLVRWIRDPREIDQYTAMPDVGLDEQQARDAAAYLYALK